MINYFILPDLPLTISIIRFHFNLMGVDITLQRYIGISTVSTFSPVPS